MNKPLRSSLRMVPCFYRDGAFSGTKLYEVKMGNGVVFSGGGPTSYFWGLNGGQERKVGKEPVPGWMACLVLEDERDKQLVELAGADHEIWVDYGMVHRIPEGWVQTEAGWCKTRLVSL